MKIEKKNATNRYRHSMRFLGCRTMDLRNGANADVSTLPNVENELRHHI